MADQELDRQEAEDVADATNPTAAPDRQPEAPRVPNLDDLPDFRKWKSESDKRIAAAERAAQEAAREAVASRERLRQMEMQGLDEVGKLSYYAREQEQRAAQAEQQLRQLAELRAWDREVAKIAAKTGADMDTLNQAADISQAWEMGYEHARKAQSTTKNTPPAHEPEESADVSHMVDVGGGSAPSGVDKWQRRYDEARKNNDGFAMLDIMAESSRKGIAINEW